MRRPDMASGPEFDFVRSFVEAASSAEADPSVLLGPGDDAAALEPPAGEQLVLTVDTAVEEVHFRRAWLRWETVGYRAAAAAASDLAAMAARPLGFLVSVALPPELGAEVLGELAAGVSACLELTGGTLLGGDLARSPGPVMISVTVAGAAERPVERSGAGPGDELWVTGRLGGAATAAADWTKGLEPDPRARRAFARPRPRIREARWLARRTELTALIDISDGLAGDAAHVAAASGAGLDLRLEAVPLAEVLEEWADRGAAVRRAVTGGEDYELLLAARRGTVEEEVEAFRREFGTPLTRVGEVTEGEGVRWLDEDGSPVGLEPGGYDHFAGPPDR